MDILLPWKKKAWNGKKYQAKLRIQYFTTILDEDIKASLSHRTKIHDQSLLNIKKQISNNSARKCPGHKKKDPKYDSLGKCSICGGYKY